MSNVYNVHLTVTMEAETPKAAADEFVEYLGTNKTVFLKVEKVGGNGECIEGVEFVEARL